MAIGFPAGISEQYVVNNAQAKLAALRTALEDCANFYEWLSAYSAQDLEADPIDMDSASAQAIFNAFADASFLAGLADGADPGDHPFPYNFLASMRVVIGPLT